MKRFNLVLLVTACAAMVVPLVAASVIVDHASWSWYNSQGQAVFDRVGALRVYFTHASVGANICDGLSTLHVTNAAQYKLAVVSEDAAPPSPTVAGCFYEYNRGNPGWQPKIDGFDACVANGWHASAVDFAMNKLCFIDQTADVNYCLSHHAALQAAYPATKFIFCTMPLMTASDSDNVARNVFNAAVRTYAASHDILLLDVADIEAYAPSGTQSTFTYSGTVYQMLYSGYTSDNGHPSTAEAERRLATAVYSLLGLASAGGAPSTTHTVTFLSGGNGSIAGAVSQTVSNGASCTPVTAVASSGWHFQDWTGSAGFVTSTANPLTVTNVTADMLITANFANEAPQVSISNPVNNAVVSGIVPVLALASDDHSVTRVELYVDAVQIGSLAAAPYLFAWNSGAGAAGVHTLRARAYDDGGLWSESAVTVRVSALSLSLQAERLSVRSWLIRREYGRLHFSMVNPDHLAVASFVISRRSAGGSWIVVRTVPVSALQDNACTYTDAVLPRGQAVTYRVTAQNATGAAIGMSNDITI